MKIHPLNKKLFFILIGICALLIQNSITYSQTTTKTYAYTGGVQTFTVPCGVFNITAKAWGGGGSGGGADSYIGAPGGGGGFVSTDIAVTPGQVLTIVVGGGGGPGGNCAGNAPGGTGGWGNGMFTGGRGGNSGATGCSGGGGAGGGASAVFDGGTMLVVAGGGGGGSGGGLNSAGGAGGGGGQNGNTGSGCSIGIAGASSNGIGLQGGDRGGADGAGGGGGGGGYNGGSGGGSPPGCDCGGCGGGGGNSFSAGTNISILNGSGQTAGNSGDPDLPSGAAVGGYSSAGGNGFISLVYIDGTPVADFSVTSVCRYNQTAFTDATITVGSITSLVWDFGNGSPQSNASNPTYTYPTDGNYNATLIATNSYGCIDTVTKPVTVYPLPIANFTSTAVCHNQPMSFNDASTVSNGATTAWSWDFGDGTPLNTSQTPAHTYSAAGTYTATLIATTNNGCKDTVSKNTTVHALPVAQFTTVPIVCHGKYATFNEASTIAITDTIQSWQWDFDDGSALLNQQQVTGGHLYSATGTYNVDLIVTSTFGCKDTVTKTLFVRPKPVANFGSTKVCDGTNTVFSDSSTTAAGSINVWNWNFGDGSAPSITQNPSHLFADAGIQNVTLIAQNTFGCTDTVTKPVQVYYNPVANFTTQDVCLNDSVFFTDSSYSDNSAIVNTYLWVFADGTPTSNLKNPGHLYAIEGTYNVTLVSTTDQGCSDAVNKPVLVFDPPTSNFSVADVCLVDSAIFINSSANPDIGTIASWVWSLGDGTTNTTTLNPTHLYTAAGTYPVTLITRSSNLACADTLTDSITVFPMPVANFFANDICLAQAMNFDDSSSVSGNSTITAWNWSFGDGSAASTLQNPAHTYAAFGAYDAVLIATTNQGCKDTISKNVIVHPLPTAAFSSTNVCLGDSTQFTNQSQIPSNTTSDVIQSWLWDFDDSSPIVTTPNCSHLYAGIGTYDVELKVISDFGCPDSITQTIVVNPNPVVVFSATDTVNCEPLCVSFSDASTISPPGNNVFWSWDLGDGTITTNADVYHCYTNDLEFTPKQFSVTLTVTSDSGCVSVLTKNNYITVYPEPVATFSVSPTVTSITNPVIEITTLSTGADFWSWQFGNADTSALQNPPEQTYADTGSYIIRLITSTQYGCVDTSYQTIIIKPDFTFYVPNAFTPNEDGINDTFTGQGIFINEFEMTIFDRWGKQIYKTDDINKPWDGKFNNGVVQQDVYVYSIKIVDFTFAKHQYRGTITLIR